MLKDKNDPYAPVLYTIAIVLQPNSVHNATNPFACNASLAMVLKCCCIL